MKYHVKGLRQRHDGWTLDRQRAFLQALAETGSVARSVAVVGLSRASVYALRRRADAQGFDAAWVAAIQAFLANHRVQSAAVSRPVVRKGRVVAIRTVYRGVPSRVAMREISAAVARDQRVFFESRLSTSALRTAAENGDARPANLSTSASAGLAPPAHVL